jgi:hypothetical protein
MILPTGEQINAEEMVQRATGTYQDPWLSWVGGHND